MQNWTSLLAHGYFCCICTVKLGFNLVLLPQCSQRCFASVHLTHVFFPLSLVLCSEAACYYWMLNFDTHAWNTDLMFSWYKSGNGKQDSFTSLLVMVGVSVMGTPRKPASSVSFCLGAWCICAVIVVCVPSGASIVHLYRHGHSCRYPSSPTFFAALFAIHVQLCTPIQCGPPSCNNSRKKLHESFMLYGPSQMPCRHCYFTHSQ